jgi:hypothetical protein
MHSSTARPGAGVSPAYRRTSIAEIARDAGIAVGTVYRRFHRR